MTGAGQAIAVWLAVGALGLAGAAWYQIGAPFDQSYRPAASIAPGDADAISVLQVNPPITDPDIARLDPALQAAARAWLVRAQELQPPNLVPGTWYPEPPFQTASRHSRKIVTARLDVFGDIGCGCCTGTIRSGIGDDALKLVARHASLQSLQVPAGTVTDAGLALLVDLTELKVLDLQGNQITGTGLVHLSDLQNLETLNLTDNKLASSTLAAISRLPRLKTLSLRNCGLTNDALAFIGRLTSLRELDLSRNPLLTDEGCGPLGQLIELRALDLQQTGVQGAGDFLELAACRQLEQLQCGPLRPTMIPLINHWKQLRKASFTFTGTPEERHREPLVFADCPQLQAIQVMTSVPDLEIQVSRLPQLHSLAVGASVKTTTASLGPVSDFNPGWVRNPARGSRAAAGLKSLQVSQLPALTTLTLPTVEHFRMADVPRLHALELRGAISVTHCQTLAAAAALSDLRINCLDGSDPRAFQTCGALPQLKKLVITGYSLDEAALMPLSRFPLLQELEISGQAFTPAGLASLADLTELQKLVIVGLEDPGARFPQRPLPARLEHLGLLESQVAELTLEDLPRLEILNVDHVQADRVRLHRLPLLKRIAWGESQYTNIRGGVRIQHLSIVDLPQLERLDVRTERFPGPRQIELDRLPNLIYLEIKGQQHNPVTDDSFRNIASFPRLKLFRVPDSDVGDETLQHLADAPAIVHIDVRQSKVTTAGIVRLKSARSPILRFIDWQGSAVDMSALKDQLGPGKTWKWSGVW